VIYTHAGQDATCVFTGFHSGAAWDSLTPFLVGECDETIGVDNAFEADIRGLFPEMHRRGLFHAK
jgi:hypothetical protein